MVRWLEENRYDVKYATTLDAHRDPAQLLRAGILFVGHDEYWSREMRSNVEAARDSGVNLGFFSGNTCWGEVQLDASLRDMRLLDLFRKGDDPEESLMGITTISTRVGDVDMIVDTSTWPFRGTGLADGDRLRGVVGYEAEGICWNHTILDKLILAETPVTPDPQLVNDILCKDNGGNSHMTAYTAPSGALVFAAGTIHWSWGLDDYSGGRSHESSRKSGVTPNHGKCLDTLGHSSAGA